MSGFAFKQFKVEHDLCAMKVSTDGILLGAWAKLANGQSALDIGTGTGLLALMCKQRTPSVAMTAVEIDGSAYHQAKQNIEQSPWPDIALYHQSIQEFATETPFDVVISNPPYFNNSLKGDDAARNAARHTDGLSFAQLISAFKRLTHDAALFNLILPSSEAQVFIAEATAQGLYLQNHCLVQTKKTKPATRSLMCFGYQEVAYQQQNLIIHNGEGGYSKDYIALCKDFYLKM
ncbi:methyltransferase [Pseudoalteromonas shioyasakiensis]|uniref:tRNA1(Val) (adenine(37)-N6)-methyltransferase n=1 Tax=Pseudoalteromonas shioyasakiensis TaxID=1190813 RepID=UPI002117794C|nr:methyltransferase [Pseudoalteromonas shioyasakiensis]MCQ8877466.1 methyltransferase [Pseudoalteromonas shioyasakiensis]